MKRILTPISNSKEVEKTPHIKKYQEDLLQDAVFDADENTEKEIEKTLTQKN
jgi:hypothetical protein